MREDSVIGGVSAIGERPISLADNSEIARVRNLVRTSWRLIKVMTSFKHSHS